MDREAPFERPTCPFCSFNVPSQEKMHMLELFQHVEFNHSENDGSPFRVRDSASARATPRSPLSPGSPRFPSSPHPSASPRPPSSPLGLRPTMPSPRQSWGSWEGAVSSRGGTPSPTFDPGDYYVECPLEECGEAVHVRSLDHHLDFHESENMLTGDEDHHFDTGSHDATPRRRASPGLPLESPTYGRSEQDRPRSQNRLPVPPLKSVSISPARRWSTTKPPRSSKGTFLGPASRKTRSSSLSLGASGIKRLGIEELGPYAYEDKMPKSLRRQLENGAPITIRNQLDPQGHIIQVESVVNEVPGLIPLISRLCRADSSLSKVFLCDPKVKHIFKMPKEGGFCGYRNIQMVVSFLQQNKFPGAEHFPGNRTPSVLDLQNLIESAWDKGYDSHSRTQTGGIKGTRKYIGTPEAQALFSSLGIGCEANMFNKPVDKSRDQIYVHDKVYEAVFKYFCTGVLDPHEKIYQTGLAPIYFQHPGHSLTIIGLEVRKSGGMNLLVFDPMFKTPAPVLELLGSHNMPPNVRGLLKPFRRGDSYLKGYTSFEILKLTGPRPANEALKRVRNKNSPSPSPSRRNDRRNDHRNSNHDIVV